MIGGCDGRRGALILKRDGRNVSKAAEDRRALEFETDQ